VVHGIVVSSLVAMIFTPAVVLDFLVECSVGQISLMENLTYATIEAPRQASGLDEIRVRHH
jgi:hypothetical protein